MSQSFLGCYSPDSHGDEAEPQRSEHRSGALFETCSSKKWVATNMGTSGMDGSGLGAVVGIDFTKTTVASMVAREKLDRVLDLPQWMPMVLYDAAPVLPDQGQRPIWF